MAYTRIFNEQDEEIIKPEIVLDKRATSIIKTLRDENFKSEEARKKFVDLITSLYNIKDPRSRLAFKKIGDLFTEIGDDLLKYGKE